MRLVAATAAILAQCLHPGRHWPCRARPADRFLGAEDRSAGGVRDQTGPSLGPYWVRGAPAPQGHERSPTVTSRHEEPQVDGSLTHAARTTPSGDSDCGPEGQACRAEAADGQQSTAVGINTAGEESWRIIGGSGPMHLFSPAGFHRSLPVSTPSMNRPVEARWI
jgi:hypothetical protein